MLVEIFVCALLLYILYKLYQLPRKLDLPGPDGAPILGNLLQLDPQLPHVKLSEWTKKYGGVYTLRLLSENWVVLADYEHIYQALVTDGASFAGRPTNMFRMNFISRGRRDVFLQQPHENFWGVGRKILHRSIKQYSGGMKNIEKVINVMVDRFVRKQRSFEGHPRDPSDDIYNFTLSNLLHFCVGKDIDETDPLFAMAKKMERTAVVAQSMTGRGTELDMFPWLRFFRNWAYKRLKESSDLQADVWSHAKPMLLNQMDWENPKCVMEAFLVAEKKQHTDQLRNHPITSPIALDSNAVGEVIGRHAPFDDTNMLITMAGILVAGTTTSSHTIMSLLVVLLNHPEVMRHLQEEVDDVVGSERSVTLEDRDSMPYTRAVVFEVMRYSSIVPLNMPHATLRDVLIDGFHIPKGTTVITNLWHLHHDEKFWDDPWEFQPERFLDETGQLLPPDHPNRKHLMPFGAGTRVCVGEIFALTRLFMFTSSLMQNFDVLPDPDTPIPSCDPRSYELGMVLCPKVGKLRLVPRCAKTDH